MKNKRRFKMKKSHKKGNKVNDPKTYINKRKHTAIFHSITENLDEVDLDDL